MIDRYGDHADPLDIRFVQLSKVWVMLTCDSQAYIGDHVRLSVAWMSYVRWELKE